MIATEEKFNVENRDHMDAAERICAEVATIDMEDEPVFNDPVRKR